MSKRHRKTKSRKEKAPPPGPEVQAEAGKTPPPDAEEPRALAPSVWIETERPVLRFVLSFALLMGPFTLFFYGALTRTSFLEPYLHVNAAFEWYLDLNAAASAVVLRTFGEDATAEGQSVRSPRASVEIRYGCDAILPTALFASAILAFPVTMRTKWTAIIVGCGALLAINLVRIVSLYYVRIYRFDWFHALHVDVWQPAFIFLALLFWVMWALRVTRVPVPQDGNPA